MYIYIYTSSVPSGWVNIGTLNSSRFCKIWVDCMPKDFLPIIYNCDYMYIYIYIYIYICIYMYACMLNR